MTMIRTLPVDPTEIVIQGLMMTSEALNLNVTSPVVLAGIQEFPPMPADFSPTSNLQDITLPRANAGIATPNGAFYPLATEKRLLRESFITEDSKTKTLTGITRDSAGAILGNCRVIALETGRLYVDGAPIMAETISDGSGNFTLTLPLQTSYQLLCYKPGSPDVAGTSLNTLTPE